jgi:hypothetical protein
MTTITLQVPDQLAQRLNVERDRLPQLLEWALDRFPPRSATAGLTMPAHVFTEMIDFLSSHPTTEQILAFQISPRAQTRLSELLEKNREGTLSESENAELDWYEYVHDIMTHLKAQVRPAPTD